MLTILLRGRSLCQTGRTGFVLTGLLIATALLGPLLNPTLADDTPVRVQVVKTADGWQLLRGGKSYLIKGVGGDGSKQWLAQYGGNTFRVWGVDRLGADLDDARKSGLTVIAGMWMGHKRQGFNYHNPEQVKAQFDRAQEAVRRYRNDSALLVWCIGNEMETEEPTGDPAVWQAIEDIAAMIKKEDPNHPTMTVIAEVGGDKIPQINKYCPDLDIVGINSYGGGESVGQRYREAGGTKPYVITEFGPPGQWETAQKPWGGVVGVDQHGEEGLVPKDVSGVGVGPEGILFRFVRFRLGFQTRGDGDLVRDVSARWQQGRGGGYDERIVDGQAGHQSLPAHQRLEVGGRRWPGETGAVVHILLDASSANGDPIKVTWELQRDMFRYQVAAEGAAGSAGFPEAIINATDKSADVKLPASAGGYRLYAYVRTPRNGSAVANLCLYVNTPGGCTSGDKGRVAIGHLSA